jgi:hypothetical protein
VQPARTVGLSGLFDRMNGVEKVVRVRSVPVRSVPTSVAPVRFTPVELGAGEVGGGEVRATEVADVAGSVCSEPGRAGGPGITQTMPAPGR